MNRPKPEPPLTPAWLERAARAPRPTADPAFRARAKRDFLAEGRGEVVPRSVARRPWAAPAFAWAAGITAAAASVVVVTLLNRGPQWEVVTPDSPLVVQLDGQPTPVADLVSHLHPGARIEVPAEASVDLRIADRVVMEITSATSMTLPAAPGRWFGRSMRAEVLEGEVRFATGRAFAGTKLAVRLGAADAFVVGTTFAAIRDSIGSCVCVWEGAVRMAPHAASEFVIPAGQRRVVRFDGAPTEFEPLPGGEVMKLTMLRDRATPLVGR